jgi:hypothetical protein
MLVLVRVFFWVQLYTLEDRYASENEDAKSQCLMLSGVSCLVFAGMLQVLIWPINHLI